jgi:hypothetical protein
MTPLWDRSSIEDVQMIERMNDEKAQARRTPSTRFLTVVRLSERSKTGRHKRSAWDRSDLVWRADEEDVDTHRAMA